MNELETKQKKYIALIKQTKDIAFIKQAKCIALIKQRRVWFQLLEFATILLFIISIYLIALFSLSVLHNDVAWFAFAFLILPFTSYIDAEHLIPDLVLLLPILLYMVVYVCIFRALNKRLQRLSERAKIISISVVWVIAVPAISMAVLVFY